MSYNLPICGCRNYTLAGNLITSSTINLLAFEPSFFQKVTGAIKKQDKSIFPGGHIEIRHKSCQSSPIHGLTSIMSWSHFANSKQVCEPLLVAFNGGIEYIINSAPGVYSKFPMVRATRLGQLKNPEPFFSDMDIGQAKHLSKHLNVRCGWGCPWLNKEESIWRSVVAAENESFYSVYDFDGILSCQFIIIQGFNEYIILPITIFHSNNYQHNLVAHTPPAPPYAFFNEHALKKYPHVHVFITDDIALAFANPPSLGGLYLVNIGGNAWIDGLNFSLFRGRKVTCVANNIALPDYGIIRMIELLKAQGITPSIEQNPRLATGENNYGC